MGESMKTSIYKCLLIVLAFAISGCEDPILSAPVGTIPENSQAGHKVTQITVENAGNSVLSSIILSGTGAENFNVDMRGEITVAQNAHLDYENVNAYTLTALATSTKGDSVSGEIVINILDVADVVPNILNFSAAVDENSVVGTLVGTVSIVSSGDTPITSFSLNDVSSFSINEKGEIRTNSVIDYESINHYSLNVYALNAAGVSNTATVEIAITDIADIIPRVLGFTASVKRSIPVGSVVGTVNIESIGDSPITDLSISDTHSFEISADGVVTTKLLLDDPIYTMLVTATNAAGTDTGLIEITTLADAFTVKPFIASYYFEQDGTEAGQGTDGSDPSIVPVLKHTETVARPAITYPWANEFGIDS
jgi:cadherin domain-containing protein